MTLRSDHETDRTTHEERIEADRGDYKINCMARTVEPDDGSDPIEVGFCEVWYVDGFGASRIASVNNLSDARLFVRAKMAESTD